MPFDETQAEKNLAEFDRKCLCCGGELGKDSGFVMSFIGQVKLPVCRVCLDQNAGSFIGNTKSGTLISVCCLKHSAIDKIADFKKID